MSMKPTKSTNSAHYSKSWKILALLRRNNGATIAELAKATGWQKHSVHGIMSGTLKKKRGLQIKSTKEENKDRRYSIAGNSQ
jgi:DNA-binding MarR family transcriptional regulator